MAMAMGMEYRDRAGRARRKRRRQKREEEHWASLAGPVEVRRLDDEHQGEAEDDGPELHQASTDVDAQDDEPASDGPGATPRRGRTS